MYESRSVAASSQARDISSDAPSIQEEDAVGECVIPPPSWGGSIHGATFARHARQNFDGNDRRRG